MDWKAAGEVAVGASGWGRRVNDGGIDGVRAGADCSGWCFIRNRLFAFALSLLVEVAFHCGIGLWEVAPDDVGGEAGPSCKEVALDGVDEGAGTGTKCSGVKPLDHFLLSLGSKKGVGLVLGVGGVERKAPKAVWEAWSGEYGLIVTMDGDSMFIEGGCAVMVAQDANAHQGMRVEVG